MLKILERQKQRYRFFNNCKEAHMTKNINVYLKTVW